MAFKGDSIFWVEVDKIVANPFQPRREFDQSKLQELAESVRMYGVLQPLTVTRKEISREDGTFYSEYELIAGERRWRASKLAGLQQVPVIIREGEQSEQEKLELAIIENLQREDLNAVDRALAFRQLADVFELSHSQVAKKVGRSREYVSNTLRLLLLPEYMLDSLKVSDITEGHARTLLMLNDRPEEQDTVYREILLKKLSVREVERIARKIATDKVRKQKWQNSDPALIEIEKQFTESLGTRVQIAKTDYGGKISIDYFSEDDLAELLNRLRKDAAAAAGVAAVSGVADAVNHAAAEQHDEEEEMLSRMEAATPLTTSEAQGPEVSQSETEEGQTPTPSVESEPLAPEVVPEPATEVSSGSEPTIAPEPTPEVVPEPEREQEISESFHHGAAHESEKGTTTSEAIHEVKEQPLQAQHPPFMTMEEMQEAVREKEEAENDDSDLYGIKNFTL